MRDRKTPTLEECHTKATECREMAKRAGDPSHRIMLNHMAETWERICTELKQTTN